MARVWEGESERRTVVERGGRWGGQSHICCSGCFMETGGRRATPCTLRLCTSGEPSGICGAPALADLNT